MKYFKAVFCIIMVAVLLSGCNFRISSSIDDLISPLSPFGDNADVKEALDLFASNGYSLKTPSYGKYISSYNFYDIDLDGEDEALAFYEPSDNLGTVSLAALKKTDGQWKVVSNVKGIGKDVYSLDFAQLDSKGNIEIIVCWDNISNSTSHELAVYRYDKREGKTALTAIEDTVNVSYCYVTDMFKDGRDRLLLFNIYSGSSSSPRASLCSLEGGRLTIISDTKLDSRIVSFFSIQSEDYDGSVRVYADALTSDSDLVLTEYIKWSDEYNSIDSPFYNYSTARTVSTERHAVIPSMDVDGDGQLEIPVDYSIKKLPKSVKAFEFKNYKLDTLVHKSYAIASASDKYLIGVPDEYIDSLSVHYNSKTREMTVRNKSTKRPIVSVMPALKATYSAEKYSDYTLIAESKGYCYLAKLGNDGEIKFTTDDVKNYFKAID
ncbi:MAG: hypothetical protein K6C14_05535 [Eubacterium sp.]|nr:hypothetical protein [Eubacterium sp.]